MCLGIPVKIINVKNNSGLCEINNIKKEINLSLLTEVKTGDYVILHAGFAIQKLDENEALEILDLFEIFLNTTI